MPAILLRNAEVFAPEPRGVRQVPVAGAEVAWVGSPAKTLPAEPGVAEVDLAGTRLVPGFVDDADLVALDSDGGITDVMAMGRWHVREGRVVVKGTFEGREARDEGRGDR